MIRWASFGLVWVVSSVALAQTADVIRDASGPPSPLRPNPFGGLPVEVVAQRGKAVPLPAPPGPIPGPPGENPAPPRPHRPRPIRPAAPTPTGSALLDRHGDPLPVGAIARFGTVRLRHGGEPIALGFTPDARYLASVSGTEDGIRLWDPETGKEAARLPTPVTHAALAQDGTVLIVDHDNRCKVWAPGLGNGVRELPEKTLPENVTALTVHPDGRSFAVGTHQRVVLIDLQSGKTKAELKVPGDLPPVRITFAPNGRWLAAAGQKTGVWLFDLKTGKRVRTYPYQFDSCEFAFSPDSTRLAVAGGPLIVYSADSEETEEGFTSTDAVSQNVRFASDGKSVFVQLADGTVVRQDAVTGESKDSWPPPDGETLRAPFALAAGGAFAAAVDESGGIRIWQPKTGKGPQVKRLPALLSPGLSADGKTGSCLDTHGRVYRFDATTGQPGKAYQLPVDPEAPVAWNARTGRAAVLVPGEETELHVIEAMTRKVIAKVPVSGDVPQAVLFHPTDADQLVLLSESTVTIVRISTKQTVRSFTVEGGEEGALAGAISFDGRLLALTTSPLSIWEIATGKRRFEVETIPDLNGVAFSPDGRTLMAWGGDEVAFFDCRTGKAGRRIRYPVSEEVTVSAATFTPDGKRVAIGMSDGLITLWNVSAAEPLLTFDRHDGPVTGLVFSHDGTRLLSTAGDGTALVWDMAAKPGEREGAVLGGDEALRLLASSNPAMAQQGMEFLYRRPSDTVKFLGDKISVPAAVPADRIAQLVTDLGSEDFQTRQAAVRGLEAVGSEAAQAVRQAAENSASPEVRKLAIGVLGKLDGPPTRPDELRAMRAVEVLEGIGSPEARELLKKWSAGPAAHRLTIEAADALRRMGASHSGRN